MTETIFTELKNALSTERLKPGDQLQIFRGQKIVFGSNPKRGLHIAPDTRSVRLVKGIQPHQLSRAAVAIEFSPTGSISVESLTDNNEVCLQYQSKEAPWQTTKPLTKNQAIDAAKLTGTNNLSGQLAIDITTYDSTLVRLYCCGGSRGKTPSRLDCFDFRVDLNPIRDLNN